MHAGKPPRYIDSGAVFSEDRTHRYLLWRRWGTGDTYLVCIGLNPSTADETVDDPTMRRLRGFALRELCSGFLMLNMFAYRSTKPGPLLNHPEPVGPRNDTFIRLVTRGDRDFIRECTGLSVGRVIPLAAWGTHPATDRRVHQVESITPALMCLGYTSNGRPAHPLYLPLTAKLEPYVKRTTY